MSATPTMTRAIKALIEARLAGLHVAMPGKITAYDATKQRATVQPLVLRPYTDEDGERVAEKFPPCADVPVMFPGTGPFSITWPVAIGDLVMLEFASVSLDRWKAHGGLVDPGDLRRFAFSDAVAKVGLRSFKDPIPAAGVHDTAMVIRAPAEIHVGGDQALALHAKLEALSTRLENHIHPCTGGTVGTPTGTPADLGDGTTVTKGQ